MLNQSICNAFRIGRVTVDNSDLGQNGWRDQFSEFQLIPHVDNDFLFVGEERREQARSKLSSRSEQEDRHFKSAVAIV